MVRGDLETVGVSRLYLKSSVPAYNPPPSSTMIRGRYNASEGSRTIQNFISNNLLPFQSFDGSFSFAGPDQVRELLGPAVLEVILAVQEEVHGVVSERLSKFDIATTVSILVLLEEHCTACLDLTERMCDKAREILRKVLTEFALKSLFDVVAAEIDSAELDLDSLFWGMPMQDARRAPVGSVSGNEPLEVLPPGLQPSF
jgi:hypothetical protein